MALQGLINKDEVRSSLLFAKDNTTMSLITSAGAINSSIPDVDLINMLGVDSSGNLFINANINLKGGKAYKVWGAVHQQQGLPRPPISVM